MVVRNAKSEIFSGPGRAPSDDAERSKARRQNIIEFPWLDRDENPFVFLPLERHDFA
jgi:hypothetical protein